MASVLKSNKASRTSRPSRSISPSRTRKRELADVKPIIRRVRAVRPCENIEGVGCLRAHSIGIAKFPFVGRGVRKVSRRIYIPNNANTELVEDPFFFEHIENVVLVLLYLFLKVAVLRISDSYHILSSEHS